MHRKLHKFAFFVITVLSSALLSRYVFKYAVEYKENIHPLLKVLMGMGVIVISFIPLSYFSKPIENVTKKYLETSKKVAEKKNGGIIWGLIIALIILFFFYAFLWFELTPGDILQKQIG